MFGSGTHEIKDGANPATVKDGLVARLGRTMIEDGRGCLEKVEAVQIQGGSTRSVDPRGPRNHTEVGGSSGQSSWRDDHGAGARQSSASGGGSFDAGAWGRTRGMAALQQARWPTVGKVRQRGVELR
ncbi:hypothetical protein ZWY2020_040414 [Hordeum vulgare]|nr:hypothetical protein ZWY2020_040414 [Hordeum vulgare]